MDENNSRKTQDMMEKLGEKVDKAIMSALDADEIGQLFLPPRENNRDENSKSVQALMSDCDATSGDEEQVDHNQHFPLPPKASEKSASNCRAIVSK